MTLTLTHFLIFGAVLFGLGLYGVLTRRNAIAILMSLELIFNAVNINLVAITRFIPGAGLQGQVFSLFIIAVAAAESVLGLAIILAIFRKRASIQADELNLMKW